MELEARIGTVLRGKWTLERLLGSGGMAAVYVGLHRIGRRDAIKILHPHIACESQLRARFDQEAYAVNRFVHPGAVEIRDIDVTEDGCPFLVMELLEGESVRAHYDRLGPPDIAEILRIADDVLDVLAAAHLQGIIHRDIKPDNLFYLPDGRIKVLDFGVARVRQAANELRTGTGTTLGTVAYMPPEQIKGTDIDARVDVFALGATMFRLIAKRRIHEARSDAELLVKMATQPAPPLASVAPGVPTSVCAIVDRALNFDREGRYPDATAMQQDIRAVREGEPPAFALGAAERMGAPTHQARPFDQDAPTTVMGPLTRPTTRAEVQPALLHHGSVMAPAISKMTYSTGQPGPVNQYAPTIVMNPVTPSATKSPPPTQWGMAKAQPVLLGQHRSVIARVTPKVKDLTALTQWTVTTLRERKLRWAALVFPVVAAGVLALVFYGVTRVDHHEASPDLPSEKAAKLPIAYPSPEAPITKTSPARGVNPAAPVVSPEPAEPDPAPPTTPLLNCFLTNSCEQVCDRRCRVECMNRGGCTVGAAYDAKVHCMGPERCVISCAGKCKVKSQRGAPILVHCAPGFECELEDCPGQVERCSSTLFACGSPCPG